MRLLSGDLPQIDGIRWERVTPGEYPDDDWARGEQRADLHWLAVPLTLLAAPLFILAEWWRRVRG